MHRLLWILGWGVLASTAVGVDNSYRPQGIGQVLLFRVNPFNSDQGWAMTPNSIQFNRRINAGDRWQVVFTRRTYQRLTRTGATRLWRMVRIYPSKRRRGHLFATVENSRGNPELFHSADYGEEWRYLGFQKQVVNRSRRARPRTQTPARSVPEDAGEAVDLGDLESDGPETAGSAGSSATGPLFKVYFDLILHYRPGITPLTFDNFHPVILVDYVPRPGMTFSAEVNPVPRYFQLDWELTDRLSLYLGKIQIPFDDMAPHNYFGGYLNNSQTQLPNAPAFLPDLWADLGLGIRYDLLKSSDLGAKFYLYVVNGFGAGGTDPLGEASTYPSFASVLTEDNNTDKALGGRFVVNFFNTLEVGFSAYFGRWSDAAVDSERLTIFGIDARLRARPWLFRTGYAFFAIDLPEGTSQPTFKRAGAYGELRRSFGDYWYLSALGGVLQTDDRVTDAGDQINVGGRIGYNLRLADISVAYRYDLKATGAKQGQHHAQGRIVILL